MFARYGFMAGLLLIFAALLGPLFLMAPQNPGTEDARPAAQDQTPEDQTPQALTPESVAAAISGERTPGPQVWEWLRRQAEAGDPVAQNNLGVALLRQRGADGPMSADDWFRLAAAQGNVQAGYNLALRLPDRVDTDPAILQEAFDLLSANVAQGDIPSMVALADRLYFQNREALVPDREATRRTLLARAAASGDPDYLLRAGGAFWDDVRGGADPALVVEAIGYLHAAYQAGDPRGAEKIGDILANGNPALKPAIRAAGHDTNLFYWFDQAATMGLVTAQCRYGLEMFQTLRWGSIADADAIALFLQQIFVVNGFTPEQLALGITRLEQCLTAERNSAGPNRPFGTPSLYMSKLRGNWTSLSNSPGHAAMTLGVLYRYGIAAPQDSAKAAHYLTIARDEHDFTEADQLLARLGLSDRGD